MSRKWRDAPRDDFPSLSFPLYVFTVLLHRLNLEIAPSKNATSHDIALYQLFGRRDYLRFGPLSLYLLKFHRVHVRLRKRPSIEFFIQISDLYDSLSRR